MFKKHAWKIFLLVGAVLLGGSFIIANQSTQNADEGVTLTENIKGNPEATVVVSEYSDFQCPACGQFYTVVNELMADYGDAVRFEYKHFPLVSIHPFAIPAAKAAEAAGQQGKFFEMHDKLFENQQAWSSSANPTIFFVQYAQEIGLDVETFRRHMRSKLIDEKIETHFNEARQKGYTGTPTFEINGERMNFETFTDWREQIETAINGGSTESEAEASTATDAMSDVQFGI